MSYESVASSFQSKNCKLLTTEEEYASLMQTRKIPKLKYVASCGHEHSVHFNVFKSRNTGVICPSCTSKKNGEMKNIANRVHPTPISINHFNEERCIDYFIDLIKSEYDCKKTFEGCLADLTVKPKNQPNDSWLQIQVKTSAARHGFHSSTKYIDCLMKSVVCEFIDVSNYLHHDFMIGDKKVQEKIGTCKNIAITFKLAKSNGKPNGVRKFVAYDAGENDLYWLHFPDKKKFYLLPETDVMDEHGKIRKYIYLSLRNPSEKWSKYLFEYDNVDYVRFNEILTQVM